MFVAPSLINGYGWEAVPRVYAVALLITAVLFWIYSAPDPDVRARIEERAAIAWMAVEDFAAET